MEWTVIMPISGRPGHRSVALQGEGDSWRYQRGRRYVSISRKSALRLIRTALRLDPLRFGVSVQPEHKRALLALSMAELERELA